MALACPSLWTHPEFYTAVRGTPYPLRHYKYCSGATNIPFADEILQRSAVLPVHISLNVKPSFVSRAEIQRLAGALDRRSDRIVSICVRGADASAVEVLLRGIECLPALRCIDVGKVAFSPGFPTLLPRTIDLPQLERVKLGPACRWPEGGNVYLNVKHVSIPAGSDVHSTITTTAHACPNLQSLSVDLDTDLWATASTPATDTASLRSLVTSVRAVRIFGLTSPREAWALAVFHHAERQDILIDGIAARSVENCGVIFRDLGPGVSLRVLRRARRVGVEGTDSRGRRRCVSCKESFSAQGWQDEMLRAICPSSVDWQGVTRLTVSASHWFRFLDALPAASAALGLTLVIEPGRLLDKKPPWWTPGCKLKKFPALQRLDPDVQFGSIHCVDMTAHARVDRGKRQGSESGSILFFPSGVARLSLLNLGRFSHLVRTSGVFQGFFVLSRGQIVDQDIALPEDELTLDVLLKLALGLPAVLERLSLLGVQRALYAAKKYAMLGAADILERELCTHVEASAMAVYVFASAHSCQRAADKALDRLIRSSIDFKDIPDGHGLARLICKRAERTRLFNDHLRSRATGSAFARENTGVCCHCAGEQPDSSVWGKLQLAASVRFSDTPSVGAVFAHPDVTAFAEQLEKLKCSSCGLCPYSWLKIQASLRDLAKCIIDAGSPPPM
ncbi:hypothetical protein AURDEDRAFT_124915 [Auricularia subglabra TFB-10046 SS5]|nr:hypothetical protein AURDEDRAFT_124915 [Auricularia subglabra TFB-10046 SS5]